MFKDDLKAYVNDNPRLVKMTPAGEGIYVLKYKKTVFFDNLWNDFLEECRGTIVDKDFNIISRPFTKIYNYGIEDKAPKLPADTMVTAYRKVNGFMVAVTIHKGELLVSTTGSTDSDYVGYAKDFINTEKYLDVCKRWPGYTFMFECVHEKDPHIIPELPGMYLLGMRRNEWHSTVEADPLELPILADAFGAYHVSSTTLTLGTLIKAVKLVKHEGFVFYTKDSVSSKIKSPYYLTSKWVARNPRTDKLTNMQADIKKNLDEEYYPLVDAIRANIVKYTAMDEQARLAWVRSYMEGA